MSNDRELLKLAAMAIGLEYHATYSQGCDGLWVGEFYSGRLWNPLADDGDALRLSTRLRIDILHGNDNVTASTGSVYAVEPYGQDADAATRRAITRAAAQIGKNMPAGAGGERTP